MSKDVVKWNELHDNAKIMMLDDIGYPIEHVMDNLGFFELYKYSNTYCYIVSKLISEMWDINVPECTVKNNTFRESNSTFKIEYAIDTKYGAYVNVPNTKLVISYDIQSGMYYDKYGTADIYIGRQHITLGSLNKIGDNSYTNNYIMDSIWEILPLDSKFARTYFRDTDGECDEDALQDYIGMLTAIIQNIFVANKNLIDAANASLQENMDIIMDEWLSRIDADVIVESYPNGSFKGIEFEGEGIKFR